MLLLTAVLTVLLRRTDAPWAVSFRLYLILGLVVVAVRVGFRVLFGGGYGETVVLDLPVVPLPDWVAGITLLGPVTAESLLAGLYDGLRLATIIVAVGAANSLANPRRLLASLPAALYEVGTAVVIALSLFPQLAESVQRVRRARRLRGDPGRGVAALRRVVVPVLEDALDRSLALAASMDARGYGRAGQATGPQRLLSGTMLVGGLVGLSVGSYVYLDATTPRGLVAPLLGGGIALAAVGFVLAGRGVRRTRYRPERWGPADVLTAGSGLAVAVAVWWALARQPTIAFPDPAAAPPVTLTALGACLLALLPALVAPEPAPTTAPVPSREPVPV